MHCLPLKATHWAKFWLLCLICGSLLPLVCEILYSRPQEHGALLVQETSNASVAYQCDEPIT